MRWRSPGLLILDNSCVGTVQETASNSWETFGCDADWNDMNLGLHKTKVEAKKAVEEWVRAYDENGGEL